MRKFCAISVSAVALGLGPASAAGPGRDLVTHVADYNAAQVKLAGDVVTVPDGFATYAVGSGTLELNSYFTVTLPDGFRFASWPSLQATGRTKMVLSGGASERSARFIVTGAALSDGSLILDSFAVEHAAPLELPIPPTAALPITMQSTDNTEAANNDPVPLSAPGFASELGAELVFDSPATAYIDLASPSLGTSFGSGPAEDTATILLATVRISAETVEPMQKIPVLSPNGQPNHLATADTATVTIPGLFNGISTAFVAADADCSTRLAAGVVSPSQLVYPGVPIQSAAMLHLCVTSGGTALLLQNLGGFWPILTPGTSVDFLGAQTLRSGLGGWVYAGGRAIDIDNVVIGGDDDEDLLLRVINTGVSTSTLFARLQPLAGGAPLTGPLGTVAAGFGTIFTASTITTAVSGLDAHDFGQRATLQIIASSDTPSAVNAMRLIFPHGGVIDNVK